MIYQRLSLCMAWLLTSALLCHGQEKIDFGSDVQPILAEHCYACHGPDARAREANLRLDTFEGATTGGDFADPIVPGHPDDSEVMARVLATDPDEMRHVQIAAQGIGDGGQRLFGDQSRDGAVLTDETRLGGGEPEIDRDRDQTGLGDGGVDLGRHLGSPGLGHERIDDIRRGLSGCQVFEVPADLFLPGGAPLLVGDGVTVFVSCSPIADVIVMLSGLACSKIAHWK